MRIQLSYRRLDIFLSLIFLDIFISSIFFVNLIDWYNSLGVRLGFIENLSMIYLINWIIKISTLLGYQYALIPLIWFQLYKKVTITTKIDFIILIALYYVISFLSISSYNLIYLLID
jgi:hypothetical protein